MVADLAVGALDVLELELAADDLGEDLVALRGGHRGDADQAAESVLPQEVACAAADETGNQEVELQA